MKYGQDMISLQYLISLFNGNIEEFFFNTPKMLDKTTIIIQFDYLPVLRIHRLELRKCMCKRNVILFDKAGSKIHSYIGLNRKKESS